MNEETERCLSVACGDDHVHAAHACFALKLTLKPVNSGCSNELAPNTFYPLLPGPVLATQSCTLDKM